MGAGRELLRHYRVHRDHDLLFLGHQGVPFFDLRINPFLEVSSDHCGADVHDPLLRDLREVGLIREVQIDLRLVADELHHALEGQVLVLRHVDVLDLVIMQICLPPRQDIFQEVDGRIIYRRHPYGYIEKY